MPEAFSYNMIVTGHFRSSLYCISRVMEDQIKRERRRKANFSDEEIRFLLEGILVEKDLLQSKLQGSGTVRKKKKEAWTRITAAVNASSSGVVRTEDDCQKKWMNMKSILLKERAQQKTGGGGGGPGKDTPYDDIIGAIIGVSCLSCAVNGIEGMRNVGVSIISVVAFLGFRPRRSC